MSPGNYMILSLIGSVKEESGEVHVNGVFGERWCTRTKCLALTPPLVTAQSQPQCPLGEQTGPQWPLNTPDNNANT